MGDRLRSLLEQRGWSQRYLADKLKWSPQNMSQRIAFGSWDVDTLWLIAQAMDMPTDYFFTDQDPRKDQTR